ncbi:MAG: glycoside hydrolase [Sulfurimonas sp.]|nr:glycoside hydrolase [Sulfurimonas sp.]MBU3938940.1 SH3 domain-containing protein [bacterium]MBU4024395.1 SH3 domain-containing protein [bacterium]MBU4059779.1 SH3 domain-containing protein [bacterium]MBU4110399.1 SH3 domain-containing protein [bacterium]
MKFLYAFLIVGLFFGCSTKTPEAKSREKVEIYDLVHLPQEPNFYTKDLNFSISDLSRQEKFERSYFRVWNLEKQTTTVEDIKWPFRSYGTKNGYGENLQLLEQTFFDVMYENSNFDAFSTLNAKAVTLHYLNMRLFPTIRPLLLNPDLAGEGFPFDYLQNSSIHANEPIVVSHYSKDREWVYIFSSFASGWVKASEIAFLEEEQAQAWQNAQQVFFTKENVALYDENGIFLFKSKIGMMLALIEEDEESYTLLAVSAYKTSQPLFVKTKVSKEIATKTALDFNADNLNKIMSEVSASKYGWGGMYEQRDCSSLLRDMFTPFGIWLPRNSYRQSKVGEVIKLDGLSEDEKIKTIKEKAIAFKTLLYRKGHIVLYVGTYNDEIIIFHDTWGIRTNKNGKEGRIVIGKTIFSTLKLGEEQAYYDTNSSMIKSLKSMNILY